MVIDLHNVTLDAPRSIEDTDISAKNGRSAMTTHTIGGIGPISPTAVRVQDLGSDLTLDQVPIVRVGEGGEIGPLTSGRRVYPYPPCSTKCQWDDEQHLGSFRTSVEPLRAVGGIQYPLPERATCLAPLDLSPPPPLDMWGNPLTTDIGRGV